MICLALVPFKPSDVGMRAWALKPEGHVVTMITGCEAWLVQSEGDVPYSQACWEESKAMVQRAQVPGLDTWWPILSF